MPMLGLRLLVPVVLMAAMVIATSYPLAALAGAEATARARQFVQDYESKVRPLERAVGLAWWNANVSGKDADFATKKEAQNKLDHALSDREAFGRLKEIKEAGGIDDPVLARSIEVMYLTYLEKQVDPALLRKMVDRSNTVEQAFNAFRAKVDGKEMTENEVRRVLKTSKDSERRRAVWEASKAVGGVLEADLRELVKLRNQAAAQLGFKNYHALMRCL